MGCVKQGRGASEAHNWITPALVGVVCLGAVALRLYALGRLPGINGDEAWYGVQAQKWAAGTLTDWRTPTGNLPGPIQLAAMRLLHMVFEPSFTLLRVPSVLSSIAAMGIAYNLSRRYFGNPTAAIALVLMATIPANIVYARFGWDPSHSGLIVLLALWASLAKRPIATAIIFALALWAHPTNVFAAPLLVFSFAGSQRGGNGFRQILLFVALMLGSLSVLLVTTTRLGPINGLDAMWGRFWDPEEWLTFILLLGRLLNGDTVFTYIVGRGYGGLLPLADAVAMTAILLTIATGLKEWRQRRFGPEVGLIIGWTASLCVFFVIAGNSALLPHNERYAFVLVAPSALVFAVALKTLVGHSRALCSAVIVAVGVVLLACHSLFYLLPLERSGSQSHRAFWSGGREPKATAAAILNGQSSATIVIAEDWWLTWPIAYLSDPQTVSIINVDTGAAFSSVVDLRAERRMWVVFAGGALDRRLAASGATLRATIAGTGRPALLRIWMTP